MNIQRLRNLTTGKLHTEMQHIYEDIEYITGEDGVMIHMLPNAREALLPYLQKVAPDQKLWNNEYNPNHKGEINVPPMNKEERVSFWKRYNKLPHPFAERNKKIIEIRNL